MFISVSYKGVDAGVTGSKSSSQDKTDYLPIFRSGSCAERGPKQYMEDEHICIDDLTQHIGSASNLPFPGAFYGVRMLFLPDFTVYTSDMMIKPHIYIHALKRLEFDIVKN